MEAFGTLQQYDLNTKFPILPEKRVRYKISLQLFVGKGLELYSGQAQIRSLDHFPFLERVGGGNLGKLGPKVPDNFHFRVG